MASLPFSTSIRTTMRFSSMSWVMTLLEIVKRLSNAYKDSGVLQSASFSAASIRGASSPLGSVRRLTSLSICFDDGAELRFRKSNIEKPATKGHKSHKTIFVNFVPLYDYFPISTSVKGSTLAPCTRIPQWRWGPVTRPVAPARPRSCPLETIMPRFTSIRERCA